MKSRPPSETLYNQQALQLVSPWRTSARTSYVQGGSVTIFMAQLEIDTIPLVGRWQSDTIFRYLHRTAKSFTEVLSAEMF